MGTRRKLTATLALVLSMGLHTLPVFPPGSAEGASRGGLTPAAGNTQSAGAAGEVTANYGGLPLEFEANRGQTHASVDFITRVGGATVFLTPAEAVFVLPERAEGAGAAGEKTPGRESEAEGPPAPRKSYALRMKIDGADGAARAEGLDKLPGVVNYFIGDDPAKWHVNIPTFARVRYESVYEGVDLVYYGAEGRQLEYDFVVRPGADAARVALSFEGAEALRVDEGSGDLVIETPAGEVRQRKPFVYQEAGGTRREVESGYEIKGGGRVGFRVGKYDASRALVIDPVLVYSTFLGGSNDNDLGAAIAVDAAGSAYVTGETFSSNFPTTNPFQPAFGNNIDAFITKLNPAGTARVYSTYLGGNSAERGLDIALDAAGSAYVVGRTFSSNFPTANAYQSTRKGVTDAFITKLTPSGAALAYSTYLGGSEEEGAQGIAVDAAGAAYVTGSTSSTNFPKANPFQPVNGGGGNDAFVTKLTPSGAALAYSTYLGGSEEDGGSGIAVDAAGSAYVVGGTSSPNFPTLNAYQPSYEGGGDAYVTKLSPSGTSLAYSTYLGDSQGDAANDVAVDAAGAAYVAGGTSSFSFPTVRAFQDDCFGSSDAFVTKFVPSGAEPDYSTYLCGGDTESARGIAVDAAGAAYVVGQTQSADFPRVRPFQPVSGGGRECFVARIGANRLVSFSSHIGGNEDDDATGVAVDASGFIYVAGTTSSPDFPTTNSMQPARAGKVDAFILKLGGYAISGRVIDPANNGLAGVTVTLSGASTGTATTDASGSFSFPNLPEGGDYTVTPALAGYTFSPPSLTVYNFNNHQSLNFVGAPNVPAPTPTPPTFQFSAASYGVGEDVGSAQVTVTRSGDTTQPVAVNYATNDGTANDRGDYSTAIGTLRFGAGETARSFDVFITDDVHAEGNETLNVSLSSPSAGAQLGSLPAVVLTVVDNDTAPAAANPIDATAFYVRQHYVDFLNREPDPNGLLFWTQGVESCGADAGCREAKRIDASAAFFLSIEFQQTGFLVERLYRAAFNRYPRYREFVRDTQEVGRGVVVGQGAWESQLSFNQQQFAAEFAARTDFLALYAGLSNGQYVDALNANTAGSLSAAERDALVVGLNGGTETRATVLRKVADDADFKSREFNPAFVLMQYFGYLRRNPDDAPDADFSGFNFWLAKLDSFGGDFRRAEMVRAFLLSAEYRQRFGQ